MRKCNFKQLRIFEFIVNGIVNSFHFCRIFPLIHFLLATFKKESIAFKYARFLNSSSRVCYFKRIFKVPSIEKKENKKGKIFVLDTNVLLHDPQCLYKFEDNTIAIPVEVLEELDRKKSAPGELGFSARKIHRDLRALFDDELETEPKLKKSFQSALSRNLPNGGQLVVVINDFLIHSNESETLNRLRATLLDMDKMDSRILASVFFLKEISDVDRVVLVTKDANMALKGIALGLEVQDYMNDKVTNKQFGNGFHEIELSQEDYELFVEEHGVDLSPEKTKHLF